MARQPLSSLRNERPPGAMIMIGPATFSLRPHLAHIVAQIITGWAQVEANLSAVFGTYAHMSIEVALNVYNGVEGYRSQKAMLDAAAKCVLSPDDYLIYSATMAFIKRRYNTRNEMAHWMWGTSDEFPDDLIIMEPVAHRKARTISTNLRNAYDAAKMISYLKASEVSTFIYKKRDLEEHAAEMFRAEALASRLGGLMITTPSDQHVRKLFLSEPQILQDYTKLKAEEEKRNAK